VSDAVKWGTVELDRGWDFPAGEDGLYETGFVATTTRGFAPLVLDLVAPLPGEHLLDVACGTGALTHLAAARVGASGRVVGLDFSPGMLAVAARKTHRQEGTAEIEWIEGDAGALPFTDASFDAVCCQLGLQFFSDRADALREMHRVLKPGGRVGIMTWGPIERCPSQAVMQETWTRNVGPEKGALFALQHALPDPAEVRGLLDAAGFRDAGVETATGTARFASPAMLTRAYGTGLGIEADAATRARIIAEVEAALAPFVGEEGLVCPMEAVLARARR
jgi:ubiquinone/menaquinone biosynthesis C-methylase UbiE